MEILLELIYIEFIDPRWLLLTCIMKQELIYYTQQELFPTIKNILNTNLLACVFSPNHSLWSGIQMAETSSFHSLPGEAVAIVGGQISEDG